MKRIIILLAMLTSCIACNKKGSNNMNPNSNGSSPNNTNDSEYWLGNVLTVTDYGNEYKVEGKDVESEIIVFNTVDSTTLFLKTEYDENYDFEIVLMGEKKGANEDGLYIYSRKANALGTEYGFYYTEKMKDIHSSGQKNWIVDSSIIKVTSSERFVVEGINDFSKISGTYQVWASAKNEKKVVSGTFISSGNISL